MLTAEEERSDGSFHCPSRRRNEALDCRVMNMCAADVYLDSLMQELRAAAKDAGATKGQVDQIGIRWVLDWLKRAIGNNK